MKEPISNSKSKAQYFHPTKRFVDDLRAINEAGEIGCVYT